MRAERLRQGIERHPLAAFVLLAYGSSWLLGVVAYDERLAVDEWLRTGATYAAKFGPSLAGLLLATALGGAPGLRQLLAGLLRWRVALAWYVLALAGPAALWYLAATVYLWASDIPGHFDWSRVAGFLPLLAMLFFLGGGLGEELGWRGFLLPRLLERHGPIAASLAIGLVWGLWHAPVFFYAAAERGGGLGSLALFTAFACSLSLLFTWVWRGTSGSLLLAVLLHASINATESTAKEIVPLLQNSVPATILYGVLVLVCALLVASTALRHAPAPTARAGRVLS